METLGQEYEVQYAAEQLLEKGFKPKQKLEGAGLNFKAEHDGKFFTVKCALDDRLNARIWNEREVYDRLKKMNKRCGHDYAYTDSGERSIWFLAVPYVEGQDLYDHMRDESNHTRKNKLLSIERCVYLGEKMC